MNGVITSIYSFDRGFLYPLMYGNGASVIPGNYLENISNYASEQIEIILETHRLLCTKTSEQAKAAYKEFFTCYKFVNDKVIYVRNPGDEPIELNSKQAQVMQAISKLVRYNASYGFNNEKQIEASLMAPAVSANKAEDGKESLSLIPSGKPVPKELHAFVLQNQDESQFHLPQALLDVCATYLPYAHWDELQRLMRSFKESYNASLLTPHFLRTVFDSNPHILRTLSNSFFSQSLMGWSEFNPKRLEQPQEVGAGEGFAEIANQSSRLEHIAIQGDKFTPKSLAEFLQRSPNITSIEFNQCDSDKFNEYIAIVTLFAKNLKAIKIVDCAHMTDEALHCLAFCPALTSFEFYSRVVNTELSDYGFTPFLKLSKGLQVFKLTNCPRVTEASIHLLVCGTESCPNRGSQLVEFGFSYCGTATQDLFNALRESCPNLHTLELGFAATQCKNDNDLGEKTIALAALLTQLPLRSFKISHCTYFNMNMCSAFLNGGRHRLENFEMFGCMNVDVTFFKRLSKCSQLRNFKYEPLTEGHTIQAAFLNFLNDTLLNLETFGIFQCRIDQDVLVPFLISKSKLKTLIIDSFTPFDSKLIQTLATHNQKLQALELTANGDVSLKFVDRDIETLTGACKDLNVLHLKSNGKPRAFLSSQALKFITENTPTLTHLTLSHVQINSDAATKTILEDFATHCRYLQHLGLPGSNISSEQAISLFSRYPRQILSIDLGPCLSAEAQRLFSSLMTSNPQLRALQLISESFNGESVQSFMSSKLSLKYLDVRTSLKSQGILGLNATHTFCMRYIDHKGTPQVNKKGTPPKKMRRLERKERKNSFVN